MIAVWEEHENSGELVTRLPPSPEYSNDDCEIIGDKEFAEDIDDPVANA